MKSSSKINLRDVLLWKFIKNAYRFEVQIIAKLSKEGCIFLIIARRPSYVACKHD
jgi:hypothetical protein